jgi:hypothetical protein
MAEILINNILLCDYVQTSERQRCLALKSVTKRVLHGSLDHRLELFVCLLGLVRLFLSASQHRRRQKLRQCKPTMHEFREKKRDNDEVQLFISHTDGEHEHLDSEQKPAERKVSTKIAPITTKA